MDDTKSLRITQSPFKIVQKRPKIIPFEISTFVDEGMALL
jgi:hypothetical protein